MRRPGGWVLMSVLSLGCTGILVARSTGTPPDVRAPGTRSGQAAADNGGTDGSGPRSAGDTSTLSPFGVATSAEASRNAERFIPLLPKLGAKSLRLVDKWPMVEPQEGSFTFARDIRRITLAAGHGVAITGLLHQTARWALPPGVTNVKTFPATRLPAWRTYVATTIRQLGDRVKYWEVWNEPNTRTFNTGGHSARDYANLVRAACVAARRVRKDVRLAVTAANYDVRFLSLAIGDLVRTGHSSCVDFVAVHPYELTAGMAQPDGEIYYLQIVNNLRAMLRKVAPDRAHVPIWFTELGAKVEGKGPGSTVSQAAAADLLVKAYVLGLAQGVAHLQWFELQDAGGSKGLGLLDEHLQPRTAYRAYRALTTALGSHPEYAGWLRLGPEGRGYGFVFRVGSRHVLSAWAPVGHRIPVSLGAGWRVVDVHTGGVSEVKDHAGYRLNRTPRLFLLPPTAHRHELVRRAGRNRDRPFPWGSPPAANKKASLDLHGQSVGDGLRLISKKDGQRHRFPDGSGGMVIGKHHRGRLQLALDPSFANYRTHNVRITVWARALGSSGTADGGMNLWYQPASGGAKGRPPYPYENAHDWFGVPADGAWHKHTWHLRDAMFVNTFGYGFSLVSDGLPATAIARIEVTK